MRADLNWFFHLCGEQEILTPDQIHTTLKSITSLSSLDDVAGVLTESGWVQDPGDLRDMIKQATRHAKKSDDAPTLPLPEGNDPRSITPDFSALDRLNDEELSGVMLGWLAQCSSVGISDVHISSGARPRIRHHRSLVYLSDHPLDAELAERMNLCLLSSVQKEQFREAWELDFALDLGEQEEGIHTRLRANLFYQHNGVNGVFHIARGESPGLEELGFPNASEIRNLLAYHNGLILVTGPVGSGKTTTLASLVRELNHTRRSHIVAIEDPVEVIQQSRNCIVTQREIRSHVQSFDKALRSALREDPDIIVVGELRDLETIEMAITAAETGHLVIGTLHTRDAASTLNRILNVFPPRLQPQIRAMVADSLRGVICQQLLPSTDGGVTLACEFLVNNTAVANSIREAKDGAIGSAMQTGKRHGMRTMDESVLELYRVGRISRQIAEDTLRNPSLIDENI